MNGETEYQVINAWRNSKVQQHDTVSSILFPIAALVFFSSFAAKDEFQQLPYAAYLFTVIVVGVWRFWGRYQGLAIIRRYPRIVKLEEHLGYTFTRQYLREKWWPNCDPEYLPTRNHVTRHIELYESLPRWERWFVAYYFLFRDWGHLCWDILALLAFFGVTTGCTLRLLLN